MSGDVPNFSVGDFTPFLRHSQGLALIGGQAVAWWEQRYLAPDRPIASRDVDFWGDREEMEAFLKRLGLQARYPHRYEMTVLLGVADIKIHGRPSQIEFLHTVPGLDVSSRETSTVKQECEGGSIRVLDPISLSLTKLHALRNFDQRDRLDLLHLKTCLAASREFLIECLQAEPDIAHWHIERLVKMALQKRNWKAAANQNVKLLDAVPIDELRLSVEQPGGDESIARFLEIRWPEILRKTEAFRRESADLSE
ncbi:MAG: hypothetical protein ACI9VS_001913 [Candidatus Binatia bacterium]|jgi:hypothetical protein